MSRLSYGRCVFKCIRYLHLKAELMDNAETYDVGNKVVRILHYSSNLRLLDLERLPVSLIKRLISTARYGSMLETLNMSTDYDGEDYMKIFCEPGFGNLRHLRINASGTLSWLRNVSPWTLPKLERLVMDVDMMEAEDHLVYKFVSRCIMPSLSRLELILDAPERRALPELVRIVKQYPDLDFLRLSLTIEQYNVLIPICGPQLAKRRFGEDLSLAEVYRRFDQLPFSASIFPPNWVLDADMFLREEFPGDEFEYEVTTEKTEDQDFPVPVFRTYQCLECQEVSSFYASALYKQLMPNIGIGYWSG
jgi:hypothetical protein